MSNLKLSDEIYQTLKSSILNNDLKQGERLIETNISKKLNVSRTPVREALRKLEKDGLIKSYPRRGSVVSELNIEDCIELYEVREALESLAIVLIVKNINISEINLLKDIVIKMEEEIKNKRYENLKELHKTWSDTILHLTENKLLKDQLFEIYQHFGRIRKISLYDHKQSINAYKEVKYILSSIIDNDIEKVEFYSKNHVKNAKERFIETMKDNEKIKKIS